MPENVRVPQYVDFEEAFDFQSSMNVIRAAELNQASAMKARAEAWQTANYAGSEADARTASARSAVDLNERRGHEINAAIRFIEE